MKVLLLGTFAQFSSQVNKLLFINKKIKFKQKGMTMTKKGSYSSKNIIELTIATFNILVLGIVFGYTVYFFFL